MHASISDLTCPYAVDNGGKFLLEFFECARRRMGTIESVHKLVFHPDLTSTKSCYGNCIVMGDRGDITVDQKPVFCLR